MDAPCHCSCIEGQLERKKEIYDVGLVVFAALVNDIVHSYRARWSPAQVEDLGFRLSAVGKSGISSMKPASNSA